MGEMVVCSPWNGGLILNTIVNPYPCIFTVAACNMDQDFECTMVVGGYNSLVQLQFLNAMKDLKLFLTDL